MYRLEILSRLLERIIAESQNESLPKSSLKWEWKPLKEAGVTFIKDDASW